MLKIYDNRTKKKEIFKPIEDGKIKMYVCGPTLYDDIHIGNARPIVFFDFVYRCLEKLGYDVKYVSNITDIDDKIIARSQKRKMDEKQYVDEQLEKYIDILEKLGIEGYDSRPTVTEYINDIIKYIENLLEKGYAYQTPDGDVYFRSDKISDYGKMSGRETDELISGLRASINPYKEQEIDFALWKHTKSGISWDASFGRGRPGWHTECAVIINETLGKKIDIHGGGIDLRFPHHENENAQNIAINGNDLANFWIYNGFVNINNEKMSKSLNNFITVKSVVDKYGESVLKLLLLQTNYRQPINITEEFINQTIGLYEKIKKYVQENKIEVTETFELDEDIEKIVENDFNTPNLISLLLKSINEKNNIKISQLLYLLGLKIGYNIPYTQEVPDEILILVKERNLAKKQKNFELSDKLRDEIEQKGYVLLDTREGTEIKVK